MVSCSLHLVSESSQRQSGQFIDRHLSFTTAYLVSELHFSLEQYSFMPALHLRVRPEFVGCAFRVQPQFQARQHRSGPLSIHCSSQSPIHAHSQTLTNTRQRSCKLSRTHPLVVILIFRTTPGRPSPPAPRIRFGDCPASAGSSCSISTSCGGC